MKIPILVAVLLITPALCVIAAEESDGASVTRDNVLMCEVYKVDITIGHWFYGSSFVHHIEYFERENYEGKRAFEEALENHEPLPLSDMHIGGGGTVYDLTVYVFGYMPQELGPDGLTNLYFYTGSEYIYLSEEDRITDAVPRINIPSGQTITITVQDIPDEVALVLSHKTAEWYPPTLSKGINKIDITSGEDYAVYGTGRDYSEPYVSYTIEYEDQISDKSVYGYVFAAAGAVFVGTMIVFGLPQRIKDR